MLASSRALAGDRSLDVYVGIDVFGRGCYGGGGFNSYKVSIITICREGLVALTPCCIFSITHCIAYWYYRRL